MQISMLYLHKFTTGITSQAYQRCAFKFPKRTFLLNGNKDETFGMLVRYFTSSTDGNGRNSSAQNVTGMPRLLEIGKLENLRIEPYAAGQIFLHKTFSFRGIVLFSWSIKVIDTEMVSHDPTNAQPHIDSEPGKAFESNWRRSDTSVPNSEVDPRASFQTYYQVLIDQRDVEALKSIYNQGPTQVPSTSLGKSLLESNPFSTIFETLKGFTYVAHEDILPYIPTESKAIEHEHLERFLTISPDNTMKEKPTLTAWRAKFQEALSSSEVRRVTSKRIRMTIMPSFLGYFVSTPGINRSLYCWIYDIRLENLAKDVVTVKEEEWKILDSDMKQAKIMLAPLTKTHVLGPSRPLRLTSQCPAIQRQGRVLLPTANGFLWCQLTLEREDGEKFICRSPTFTLRSPKMKWAFGTPIISVTPER